MTPQEQITRALVAELWRVRPQAQPSITGWGALGMITVAALSVLGVLNFNGNAKIVAAGAGGAIYIILWLTSRHMQKLVNREELGEDRVEHFGGLVEENATTEIMCVEELNELVQAWADMNLTNHELETARALAPNFCGGLKELMAAAKALEK